MSRGRFGKGKERTQSIDYQIEGFEQAFRNPVQKPFEIPTLLSPHFLRNSVYIFNGLR